MIYRGPWFLAIVWFGSSLTAHPSTVSKVGWRHTGRLKKSDNLLTWKREGRGRERSRIIQSQESLVLYKSFNALWRHLYTATSATDRHSSILQYTVWEEKASTKHWQTQHSQTAYQSVAKDKALFWKPETIYDSKSQEYKLRTKKRRRRKLYSKSAKL